MKYRINRPYIKMADGPFPKEEAWREIGLGHLLPLKLTGMEWPVTQSLESSFVTGPAGHFMPANWHRVSDDLEIGIDGTPPPEMFARSEIVPGGSVTDSRGHKWIIPAANPQSPACSIPHEITWTMDGPTTRMSAKYGPVVDLCTETFEHVISADSLDYLWSAERALQILQINYRIGRPELIALEQAGTVIVDRDFAAAVVLWFIDFRLVEDVVKKKGLAELTCSEAG